MLELNPYETEVPWVSFFDGVIHHLKSQSHSLGVLLDWKPGDCCSLECVCPALAGASISTVPESVRSSHSDACQLQLDWITIMLPLGLPLKRLQELQLVQNTAAITLSQLSGIYVPNDTEVVLALKPYSRSWFSLHGWGQRYQKDSLIPHVPDWN